MALPSRPVVVASAIILATAMSAAAAMGDALEIDRAGVAARLAVRSDPHVHAEVARRWDGPLGRAVAAAATRNDVAPELMEASPDARPR